AVRISDGIYHFARSVGEFDAFAFVAQGMVENAGDRRGIIFLEPFAISAQHQEPLCLDPRSGRQLEFHPSREGPAAQIDRLITGVVQLNVLQVLNVVGSMVETLIGYETSV